MQNPVSTLMFLNNKPKDGYSSSVLPSIEPKIGIWELELVYNT
jgi:hypothetical protein